MNSYIELKNINKKFGNKTVLKNICLSVPKGETVGVIGGNGSGKSVLFKIISGFLKADSGEVYIRGEKLGERTDFPENMGVFINSPGFVDIYTGFQNLKYLASIRGEIGDAQIIDAMNKVGLDYRDKTKVKGYSLGMKQKLGIAQAFMENQEIILLDEPFNALDFQTYQEIRKIILDLKKAGKTILLISHNYTDIEKLCNRIYVIKDGYLTPATEEIIREYKIANGEIRSAWDSNDEYKHQVEP
jgi:ABC-2 type transport system ATP-binding protein